MLSIARVRGGPGSEEYNREKFEVDYRTKGERPSEWMGSGATRLGLKGQVDPQAFRHLFRGLKPDGSDQLVNLASIRKDLKHCSGHDQVFSAPKSVSVAWGLFPEWKLPLEKATWSAVREAIAFEESHVALARRGKGGVRREPGQMVVAAVQEGYGRNLDPQLHIHAFTFNLLGHSNGFGTFDTKRLYERQLEPRQVFLAALALNLKRDVGFTIEGVEPKPFEPGDSFRVAGVPQPLCDFHSSRRAEILAAKAKTGATTAKQMDALSLATRRGKVEIAEPILREEWQSIAKRMGYDLAGIRQAILQPRPSEKERPEPKVQPKNGAASESDNGEKATRDNVRDFPSRPKIRGRSTASPDASEGAFTKDGLRTQSDRVFASQKASILESLVRSALEEKLPDPMLDRLIDRVLDEDDKRQRFANKVRSESSLKETRESLDNVLATAIKMNTNVRHAINPDRIRYGVAGNNRTSRPADVALVDVLSNKGAIACVESKPGIESGKLVAAMVQQYLVGFKPKVFAASATGASELETTTQVPVHHVNQLLYRMQPPVGDVLRHHATQLLRAAMDKPTWKFERWKVDKRSVIVVTEAQRLYTRDLETLLAKAESVGAKVILVGDANQSSRREPHNAFAEVSNRVGKVSLPEPVKHSEQWVTDANRQIAQGDIRGGLSEYANQKRLHISKDQRSAAIAAVEYWKKLPKVEKDGKSLLITGTEREAKVVNKLAQNARRQAGELGRLMWQRVDNTWVYRGDRVMFHIGSRHYGFRAGDFGTIERINLSSMTIKLDRTKSIVGFPRHIRVDVPKDLYRGLKLGYAVDATDATGVSCERALVIPKAGGQDLRGLCTQLGCGRNETHIFATPRTVGEDVEAIGNSQRVRANTATTKQSKPDAKHEEQEERTMRKQAQGLKV